MRLLFTMDSRDYDPAGPAFVRDAVRAVILHGGCLAMVYSQMYGYYKFPGGGLELGESYQAALCREVREETGLVVCPESVRPYGRVQQVQRGHLEPVFVQNSFYFLCRASGPACSQRLDAYEAEEGFTLRFVPPETAMAANRAVSQCGLDPHMLVREVRVLERLYREGIPEKGRTRMCQDPFHAVSL